MLGTGQSDILQCCQTETAAEEVHVSGLWRCCTSWDRNWTSFTSLTNDPGVVSCPFICEKGWAKCGLYPYSFLWQGHASITPERWSVFKTGLKTNQKFHSSPFRNMTVPTSFEEIRFLCSHCMLSYSLASFRTIKALQGILISAAEHDTAQRGVAINPGRGCWYRSLRTASRSRRSIALPYLLSLRPSSFHRSKLWIVNWGCRMGWAGKLCGAQWAASRFFCSLPESIVTVLIIVHPRLTASRIAKIDEGDMPVPALRWPETPVPPGFPNRSVVYTGRSWADIGTRKARKGPRKLHAWSQWKKEENATFWSRTRRPYRSQHHLEMKIQEGFIEATVPANSVCLAEDAMKALDTLQKAMYTVCTLQNIDLLMLPEEQKFEHG